MKIRNVVTALLGMALAACANAPSESDASLGQMGSRDGGFNPPPGPDMRFNPPTGDMRVNPPTGDMRVVQPVNDMGVEPPADQGMPPMGEPFSATIALTEQPQAETSSVSAGVTRPMEIGAAPGCNVVQVDPNNMPPAMPGFDAGNITVNGANGGPYTLMFGANGQYNSPNAPADLFGDATMVQAQAAGGANVGAFNLSLQAPSQIRLSQPPEFSLEAHPANQDLPVVWGAAQSEVFVITVFPVNSAFDLTPRAGSWVICSVPDNGNAVVPGAQLSQVGSNMQATLVVATRTRIVSTTVGASEAFLTMVTSSGALVTLQ